MTSVKKSGLLIAAPSSGSGKTVLTLALLRAFRDAGLEIAGAKAGPDYIDPGFHELASGSVSANLDPWAMTPDRLRALAQGQPGGHLLVEGMMGLFDGAVDGRGSAAALAKSLGIPAVLVVDAAKQSHSVAALVRGFRDHDPAVELAGVILNRVGSKRHEALLKNALQSLDVAVLGAVPRDERLQLKERHLGLVQAQEHGETEKFIKTAAAIVKEACDMDALQEAFREIAVSSRDAKRLPPPGQRIAVARDEAFSFVYPHMLDDWRRAGSALSFFSPLADESPDREADAVFLPGGYPELHAGRIANADTFKKGMRDAAESGTLIYGECGGYMVLGQGLVDGDGSRHAMLGLLNLETSFERRKLHLGYRKLTSNEFMLGDRLMAHEFHYSNVLREEGAPLFAAHDALDADLGSAGLRNGNVMGSYLHVIDGAEN